MRYVIVGAGQAGGWAAWTLRDAGFTGEVVLLGEERHPPYQRPPLSKEVLLGEKPPESTYLWPNGLEVDLRLGARVRRIDRAVRAVQLADGSSVGYDKLILATGGRARRLDLPGAHYIRTIEDTLALRAAMQPGSDITVVGGGWIGLEAAAAARSLGCTVTVVEAAERLCNRVMPPVVSDYLKSLHERHGVEVRLKATVAPARNTTFVVGIGILPNVELAAEAGLAVGNGIEVDEYGVTSDPDILAVGDVASLNGVRLESWANAQNQAIAAARTLAGVPTPYREIPWFWSTQYGVNMQFLGLPAAGHEVVQRGDPAADRFSLFFLEGERIAAMVAVNTMRELRVCKRIMERGVQVGRAQLADERFTLQDLLPK
ncbi:MAG TPA: FAD-dependent oxidoreductase [Ramlibacter sp.]|nr:FAD-dependent oxidoreductase [Ramlibacter sp.]